jgi:hypothetical protein
VLDKSLEIRPGGALTRTCLEESLLASVENEHEAIISVLLDKGVDINTQNWSGHRNTRSALERAVFWGHERVVQLLLYRCADVSLHSTYHHWALAEAYNSTALYTASEQGYVRMVG